MNIHRTLRHCCLALPSLFVSCASFQQRCELHEFFPMSPGVKWTYEVHCENVDLMQPVDRRVETEVLNVVDRDGMRVAVVRGFPFDISGAEGEMLGAGKTSAIVNIRPMTYFHQGVDSFERARDLKDSLVEFVREENLFLDGLLEEGRRFGPDDQLTRTDWRYCWIVDSEKDVRIRGVCGVSAWRKHRVYVLTYFSGPGSQRFTFAPGIGILEYHSQHNGSFDETHMRLTGFHRP